MRPIRPALLAAAALALLTAAYAWPLPLHIGSALPHDSGDPLLVTWILWWSTHVMPLTAAWWNAPAFYPATGVFAFSETLLGLAPITAPIIHLFDAPIAAYNVAFLASFVLSGLAAHLLGFVVTGRHDAAFVGAIAYAFAPYRLAHLQHLQLLSSYWMPVSLAALHLYTRRATHARAALFAGAWLLQALACGYYFFFLSILAVLWIAWFFPARLTRVAAARIAVWWVAAALVMAPLLLGYQRIQSSYGFARVPSEIAYYSADVAGLAAAAPESWLWHGLRAVDQPESLLFPGFTLPALMLIAWLLARRKRLNDTDSAIDRGTLAFYCAAAVLMWVLALGPAPSWQGRPLGIPGPYAVLMWLPGFNGMRVPARLWMLAVLCLSIGVTIVVARVPHSRWRDALIVCGVLGLLADGWPARLALAADPGMQVTSAHPVARLGLPLDGNETETMYGAIAQGVPVFNGYSGYTAPQHRAMADLLARHDPRIIDRLRENGAIEIIVKHAGDPDGSWRAFVASHDGARVSDVRSGWTAYQFPALAAVPRQSMPGSRVPIVRMSATTNEKDVNAVIDGDLDSRWHVDRQLGGEAVTADLDRVTPTSGAVLSLGTYASQYPAQLEVSVSDDGREWTTTWTGDTALLAYDGALADPRRLPLTITWPGRACRFVRLRQTGIDERRGWTLVELEIRR